MAGNPACQVHEDRAAVFTGTFFESGQSIMVCGECLIDFCTVIANPPTGELPLDAPGEDVEPAGESGTDGPTPGAEPPSSASGESSPDDTTPEDDEAEHAEYHDSARRALDNGHVADEPVSTASE